MAGKLGLSGSALGALAGITTALAALFGWQAYNRAQVAPAQLAPTPAVAPPTTETAKPAPAAEPAAPAAAPEAPALQEARIDTFRQDLDGSAVLAGRAPGAAEVSVAIDGVEVVRTGVDPQGRFATIFTLLPARTPRVMQVTSHFATGETLPSGETLIIAPSTPAAAPTPEAPAEAAPLAEAQTEAPLEAEAAPAQISNLIVDEDSVTVLRAAGGNPQALAFDSISYDQDGSVVIAGNAPADAVVRVYLDSQAQGEVTAPADGHWQLTLPAVAPKLYQLRADQLEDDGRVSQRIETPFLREDPAVLAAESRAQSIENATQESGGTRLVTVQPGFTLWGIAQQTLGDGTMFVKVFEANRGQIRDPDLIYPGQVFTLPGAR